MEKCGNPEHPYCTQWVLPGEATCSSGHAQPAAPAVTAPASPRLHVGGFDPRAAGGRQTLKLELRGMPADAPDAMTMRLSSRLIAGGSILHTFQRSLQGEWRAHFIEFSSAGVEHGQHRIDVDLHCHHNGRVARRWVCTLVILVPRPDASLSDIHQTFLSTHKNVRVSADDASIARVGAQAGGGQLDVAVEARNGSIARLELDARPGKVAVSLPAIEWEEELVEIDVRAIPDRHPHPSSAGTLPGAEGVAPRHIRVFALRECVFGRDAPADALLAHRDENGADPEGLTRRLSARHAVIRRTSAGYEIEDVSRHGLLVDGEWPGKHRPLPLRLGTRIEFTASIRGIVTLAVTAVLPHGVILHRTDSGAQEECFYLVEPEHHPGYPLPSSTLPLLFHYRGGLWELDPETGRESALKPALAVAQ